MKKVLFLIITVALCTSSIAQSYRDLHRIGLTHYALPTNKVARNTISFHPSANHAAASWTTGTPPNGGIDRGTGINYYDIYNLDWRPVTDPKRIEDERTGWGTHGFTAQGEIVVAHNSKERLEAGLVVSTRDSWGTGEWQKDSLRCTPYMISTTWTGQLFETTKLVWPTMVTNGDIVHLVAVTEQYPTSNVTTCSSEYSMGYTINGKNYPTVPLYYRSSDGGKTWDIKEMNFHDNGGMTEFELREISSDSYVLAVRDNHVVFLYENSGGFI